MTTATTINVGGAVSAPQPSTLNTVSQAGIRGDEDLDDLIPADLRAAVAAVEKEAASDKPVVAVKEKAATELPKEREKEEKPKDDGDDDEELDLSPEKIDKLLEGDPDAVKKLAAEENEESDTPTWHEDPIYKGLVTKLGRGGISQEELDSVISAAADTKVISSGKLVSGLEEESTKLKKDVDLLTNEVMRLRNIERSAHFDTLEETQKTYLLPMKETIDTVDRLLNLEGIALSARQLLATKDKAAFTALIKDYDLEDSSLTQLTNYWRSFRELDHKYGTEKTGAQKDLSKHLSSNIPETTVSKVMNDSLIEFMRADPRFKYVQDAVYDDLTKYPEVSKMLGEFKSNFQTVMRALSNPNDFVHNPTWLSGLAKYMLQAAHSNLHEKKYHDVTKQLDERTKVLMKVVKEYRKILPSVKGITGTRGAVHKQPNGKDDNSVAADDFKKFIGGKLDLADLVPEIRALRE